MEALEDRRVLATLTVTNTGDSELPDSGSLRSAILAANQSINAPDTIVFNIGGGGVQSIHLNAALPAITDPLVIDGTTQLGFAGTPLIELDGTSAGASANGLNITAGNTTVRSLVINNFSQNGILISSAGNDLIVGSYIGTDVGGTLNRGNSLSGVMIQSSGNTIGGTGTWDGNVISGNKGTATGASSTGGVVISNANNNLLNGNLIGTNAVGTGALANAGFGIVVLGASTGNIIGGATASERNVVSGNSKSGIALALGPTSNLVLGNFIGTDVNGTNAIGNTVNGVLVTQASNGNTIRGNVISGNANGVNIINSNNNIVQGNKIGTNAAGTSALGNKGGGAGVAIQANAGNTSSGNLIGGTAAVARNIISGNLEAGVWFNGPVTGNYLQGNYIGTDAAGTGALPNTGNGVQLTPVDANNTGANNNIIGGTAPGAGNLISGNSLSGIKLTNTSLPSSVIGSGVAGNLVVGNSIHDNFGLGIDLGGTGVTLNDSSDADIGPNNLQNFPVLTAAQSGSSVVVSGTLNSAASTTFSIDVYAGPTADASGYGEGQNYLGATTVTTNASGNATFVAAFSAAAVPGGVVPNGWSISATATDPFYNTSEFSADLSTASGNALQSALTTGGTVAIQTTTADQAHAIFTAANALNSATTPTSTIILDLGGQTIQDTTVHIPSQVTLTIVNGTFIGGSPALIVESGVVSISNSNFTNATDSPTILVTGGSLTLRNDTVQESTSYNQSAIAVTGGVLDLGTLSQPGGNTLNVNGRGSWILNTSGNSVSALSDTFEINGQVLPQITVTNTLDDGSTGSLRAAISMANTDAANGISDLIRFDSNLAGANIVLGQGQLELSGAGAGVITVDGGGLSTPISISGNHENRVFIVGTGVHAVLNALIVTQGQIDSDDGGGVRNSGILSVTNSSFVGNSAIEGGGIYNSGTLIITNSSFSSNFAYQDGGGIESTGTLNVSDSSFTGNTAVNYGGGFNDIDRQFTTTGIQFFTRSTFTNNSARDGGGINSGGILTVTDCVITGNTAVDFGGGISAAGQTAISGSTISGNSSSIGGGINYGNGGFDNGSGLILEKCLISGNSAQYAGGIETSNAVTVVDSCFFSGNSVIFGTGGDIDNGFFGGNSLLTIADCVVSSLANANQNSGALVFFASTTNFAQWAANFISQMTASSSNPISTTLNLSQGTFHDLVLSTQEFVTLVVNGVNGSVGTINGTTIEGNSPAVVVTQGNVLIQNVTLTTSTDSPTVLFTGNRLTLRNDIVHESTSYGDAAIQFAGNRLDLGTVASPGHNTISVNGAGKPILLGIAPTVITTEGTTFQVNGTTAFPFATLNLIASKKLSLFGEPITLTADLSAPNSGLPSPSGNVVFMDMDVGTVLGTAAVTGGSASLSIATLSPGYHTIAAIHRDDSNYISIAKMADIGVDLAPFANINFAGSGSGLSGVPIGTVLAFESAVSDVLPEPEHGFTYSWSVTKEGTSYPLPAGTKTDGPGFTFLPADMGQYIVSLVVTNLAGGVTVVHDPLTISSMSPSALQNFINWHVIDNSSMTFTIQSDLSHLANVENALSAAVQITGYDNINDNFFWVPLTVNLDLTDGDLQNVHIRLNPGITVIVNALDGSKTIVGGVMTVTAMGPDNSLSNTQALFQGSYVSPTGIDDGPYSYAWTVISNNGQSVSAVSGSLSDYPGIIPDFTFTPNSYGNYSIKLTITDTWGSSATTSRDFVSQMEPFATSQEYAVGVSPFGVVVGDFNGDGISDLATSNRFSDDISILTGQGDGTFQAAVNISVGPLPVALASADFDGDGTSDLAVTNQGGADRVVILLGNHDGTISAGVPVAVGVNPTSITIGDFDRDGKADLAVANFSSSDISILLGNGDGTFKPAVNYYNSQSPYDILVADFDGDHVSDLAIANINANTVSILFGNGDGSFRTPVYISAGARTGAVNAGDFNGDGKSDLVVTSLSSSEVSILVGRGDGTFDPPVNYAVGYWSNSVVIADFNGDGKSDLAVPTFSSNVVSILFGNGDATFRTAAIVPVGLNPIEVAVGDFNQDGKTDLVTTNYSSNDLSVLLNATLAVTLTSGATFGYEGEAATFSGSFIEPVGSRIGPLTYTWSVEDDNADVVLGTTGTLFGYPATIPNFTFTPHDNGTYTVTLTVTDQEGNRDFDSRTLSVANVAPTLTNVTIGSPRITGTAITITGSATDAAGVHDTIRFAWSVYKNSSTDAYATASGTNFTFTPDDIASYTVVAIVSDEDGGSTTTSSTIFVTTIGGTAGNDIITINPGTQPGTLKVKVNNLPAYDNLAGPINVDGGEGSDTYTFNFGSSQLTGQLTIADTGSTGSDLLTVNGTSQADTLAKAAGFIKWKATGVSSYRQEVDFDGMEGVTLNAGAGNDTINDPNSGNFRILGGDGDDVITVRDTVGTGVAVDGGNGSDTFIIELGNLAGPVTFNDTGFIGSDSLSVVGTAGNDTITVTSDIVRNGAELISILSPLTALAIDAGAGNDSITVTNPGTTAASLSVVGGAGSDTVSLINLGPSVTSLSVDGGGGGDQVQVQGALPAQVTLANVAPIASISGPSDGVRGQTRSFSIGAIDSPSALAAGISYTINWGDNTAIQTINATANNGSVSTDHVYTAIGTYTITLTAKDKDGVSSLPISKMITISSIALQDDPLAPSKKMLVIGGSTGNDTIRISFEDDHHDSKDDDAQFVNVRVNDHDEAHHKIRGAYALPVSRIIVFAQAGDDDVKMDGNSLIPAWLYGGDGDDRLKGGAGNDVLLGGAGSDLLSGNDGRDLMIGGTGADRIIGDAGDDILIAGTTNFDTNDLALDSIMKEWKRADSTFATRVNRLKNGGGLNLGYLLTDLTVHDDHAEDTLTGSDGNDWFLFNKDGDGGVKDKATDLATFEVTNALDIDWLNI